MERSVPSRKLSFNAALARLGIGLGAVFVLPVLYPAMAADRWVFVLYLAWASLLQVLIRREIGGTARALVGGVVDVAAVTFLGHLMGSLTAAVVSIYFVGVTLNTVAVGPGVGVFVAVLAAAAYSATVVMEALGHLPYGPAASPWAAGRAPPLDDAILASAMVSALMLGTAFILSRVMRVLRDREAQLVEANLRLEALSKLDPLTQIYNRRFLLERIREELAWVGRGRPTAVVMIDLDRFKRLNDQRGHLAGDALLREVSEAISHCARRTDVVGRYGGDEFLVLLPDTDAESAEVAASRMVEAVREAGARFDAELTVTASIGVGLAEPGDTVNALLERADQAAYRAKQEGGDRVAAPTTHG